MANWSYQIFVTLAELYSFWVSLLVSGSLIVLWESDDGESPDLDRGLGSVVVNPLNEVVQMALLGTKIDFTRAPDADSLTERGMGDEGSACHNKEDHAEADENEQGVVHKN